MRWPRGSCLRLQAVPVSLAGSLVSDAPAWLALGSGLRFSTVREVFHAVKALSAGFSCSYATPKVGGSTDGVQVTRAHAVTNPTSVVQVKGAWVGPMVDIEGPVSQPSPVLDATELAIPIGIDGALPQPTAVSVHNVTGPRIYDASFHNDHCSGEG